MTSLIRNDAYFPNYERLVKSLWNEDFNLDDLVYRTKKDSYPKTDMYSNDKEVILEIAVPGLTKDNIKVEYADGMLTVSGEKMSSIEGKTHKKELHRSSFKRSWSLTEIHDANNITSELKNGILKLVVPLLKKENKVLNIEVK